MRKIKKKDRPAKIKKISHLKCDTTFLLNVAVNKKKFTSLKKSKKTKRGKVSILFLILASTVIGFTNGFFGGGGGMLCVPLLENCLEIDNKKAHATTIAVIVPLSLVSSVVYLLTNKLDGYNLLYTSLGVFVGGALGAVLLKKFNGKIVRLIFAIIMIVAGVKMVI